MAKSAGAADAGSKKQEKKDAKKEEKRARREGRGSAFARHRTLIGVVASFVVAVVATCIKQPPSFESWIRGEGLWPEKVEDYEAQRIALEKARNTKWGDHQLGSAEKDKKTTNRLSAEEEAAKNASTTAALESLLQEVQRRGGNIKVKVAFFDGVRGLAAAKHIKPEDTIAYVPKRLYLAPDRYSHIVQKAKELKLPSPNPMWTLGLGLLWEKRNASDNVMKLYLESLPPFEKIRNFATWSPTVQELVRGHWHLAGKPNQLQNFVNGVLKIGRKVLRPPPTEEEVKWAYAIMESRSDYFHDGTRHPHLRPVLDLGNSPREGSDSNKCCKIYAVAEPPVDFVGYEMVATSTIEEGEQIHMCYGKKGNLHLLTSLGFSLGAKNLLGPQGDLSRILSKVVPQNSKPPKGCDHDWFWNGNETAGIPEDALDCAVKWAGDSVKAYGAVRDYCEERMNDLDKASVKKAHQELWTGDDTGLHEELLHASTQLVEMWSRCSRNMEEIMKED